MPDREAELRDLVETLCTFDVVADAFLVKSFTDRLVIVDVRQGNAVPADVAGLLQDHDLRPTDAVYGDAEDGASAVGEVGGATRHHFVDVRTRGTHRSYIVD